MLTTETKKTKQSRLDLRVSPEQKELLERAASLRGLSVSSYLLSNSIEAATKDIESHEKLVLNDNDRDLFLSLMENPPEPNKALKSAMRRFQEEYEN